MLSHGGPTSSTSTALNVRIQFWTSRGFAVLDVNYGGSTGYGRAYRQRLNGQWGVVDVDDCANGAKYLVEQGLVDPNRLAIRGGSAGGYTTLCALTFRNVFKAGANTSVSAISGCWRVIRTSSSHDTWTAWWARTLRSKSYIMNARPSTTPNIYRTL